ncbi:MAG: T9SS type A sorting domain-containing protein, partial [Aureispira sp.]|nr:T9SS type A sorting domain-containing protein [Aureispira sp.]
VLFEYDLGTMTYNKLFDFSTIDGITPKGSLLQLANGKIYGMTVLGGVNNNGVLFEYDPATNVYTKKVDFDNVVTGNYPLGNLVLATNSALYGLTSSGGINNDGVLFEYNPITDIYTKKVDFDETTMGKSPNGSLLLAGNNAFYGMTSLGGANNRGVLFEYEPITNTYTKKLDFDGANNGAKPKGSLIQASSGLLYGTTPEGGSNNDGVLFEYNFLTDTYVKKLNLDKTTTGPYTRLMEVNSLPLGINTVSVEKNVRVYPNPTTGRMTIDFGKKYGTTQIKITNITGQLIRKYTVSNQQLLELELEAIAGIYIIEVRSEEGMFVELIIKN